MPAVYSTLAAVGTSAGGGGGMMGVGARLPAFAQWTTAASTQLLHHLSAEDVPRLPQSWSGAPGRVLSFLVRLVSSLGHFLLVRLRRSALLSGLLARLQQFADLYDYDAFASSSDSTAAHGLDQLIRVTRLAMHAVVDALKFANWTLNPVLFVRRLTRLAVGLFVLFVAHTLFTVVVEHIRSFLEWLRVERGIWHGDVACQRKRDLDEAMSRAATYQEWRSAAMQMDRLEHERVRWRYTTPCDEYQFRRIGKNVESIRSLIAAHQASQDRDRQHLLDTTAASLVNLTVAAPAAMATNASAAVVPAALLSPPPLHAFTLSPSPSSATGAAAAAVAPASGQPVVPVPAPPPAVSDPQALMRFLRSRLLRNIGNITDARLYFDAAANHFSSDFAAGPDTEQEDDEVANIAAAAAASHHPAPLLPCRVGTKHLIESYHNEVLRGLDTILLDPAIPPATKLSFFRETRHAYGRSALLLNGGANFGSRCGGHLGVVKALLEMEVLPQIISGSSVGAIFAALICSRTDAELSKIGTADFLSLEFPSVHGSLRRKLRRFLEEGILMDISVLIHCVRSHIGDLTFEQAYQRFGRILNIVVTPIHMAGSKKRRAASGANPNDPAAAFEEDEEDDQQQSSEPILLNYLTAPTVLIWSAACASCAVPHLYAPLELLAKNPAGEIIPYFGAEHDEHMRFGAGSVDGSDAMMDVAMDRLRTLFNTNNFIVSQLNLSPLPQLLGGGGTSGGALAAAATSPACKMMRYLGREIYQRVTNLCSLFGLTSHSIVRNGRHSLVRAALYVHSVTFQAIKGDITLIPPVSWRDYSQLLENPSTARLNACVDIARRYTWTKGSLIKAHCIVEFALDRCVRAVRNEMGLAALPSASSTFSHPPNRAITSTAALHATFPPPFPFSSSHSPTHAVPSQHVSAPASGANFWSKKLNARALQPTRRASFVNHDPSTTPIPPELVLTGQHHHHGQPSPVPPVVRASSALGGYGHAAYPPLAGHATGNGHVYPSSVHSSPSNAPRHQRNAESDAVVAPLLPSLVSPRSPLLAGAGIEFVSGSVRPPASYTRRVLSHSQPHSAPRSANASPTLHERDLLHNQHQLPQHHQLRRNQEGDSSTASTAPGSPLAADSSREDVRVENGHSAPTSPSSGDNDAHSRPASQESASDSNVNEAQQLIASLAAASPTLMAHGTPGTEGSLLRSVPSLPDSIPRGLSFTLGGSAAGITPSSDPHPSPLVLAGSNSGGRLVDDGFNRGVMAHLNQQMMFTMPTAKKPKRGAKPGVTTNNRPVTTSANSAPAAVCEAGESGPQTVTAAALATAETNADPLCVTSASDSERDVHSADEPQTAVKETKVRAALEAC